MTTRPPVDSEEAYCRTFTDAVLWRPFVEEVCARHGLGPIGDVRAGLAGTNPAFVVDDRCVVKFFAEYFCGATAYPMEREMLRLCSLDPAIPAPELIAWGDLCPDDGLWTWPYLVTTALPGVPYSEVRDRLTGDERIESARFGAGVLRRVHALPLDRSSLDPTWDPFLEFLSRRREICVENHLDVLPSQLIEQIDGYLPPVEVIVDHSVPPVPMHADMHGDHLLGEFDGGKWKPTGIIDFGDAKVGDPVYEWVALQFGLFGCDKGLLRACLERYGASPVAPEAFARRAMRFTLLHECNVLTGIPAALDRALVRIRSLDELASLIWNPETPGLGA